MMSCDEPEDPRPQISCYQACKASRLNYVECNTWFDYSGDHYDSCWCADEYLGQPMLAPNIIANDKFVEIICVEEN